MEQAMDFVRDPAEIAWIVARGKQTRALEGNSWVAY